MDIKIRKNYEYLYNEETEKGEMIDGKSSDNDIIFAPYCYKITDCGDHLEQYGEEYQVDFSVWKENKRHCELYMSNEKIKVIYTINILSDKVEMHVKHLFLSEINSEYCNVTAGITLDRDLFKEEEKKYQSLKNNHNTETLFDMILDKIEEINSFTDECNLLLIKPIKNMDTDIDEDVVTESIENIRIFIDTMINKSKSIGLKEKDIYVSISMGEINIVYNSLITYYGHSRSDRDTYVLKKLNLIEFNIPVIQVLEYQNDCEHSITPRQILLPELNSIIKISKVTTSDTKDCEVSINNTIFSTSHTDCTTTTTDEHITKIDTVTSTKIYKKIVVVGNKLHLEDILDIYDYSKHSEIYVSPDYSDIIHSDTISISMCHKMNDILKPYYKYEGNEFQQKNNKKKQLFAKVNLTETYLNSNQDLVYKKYNITDMTKDKCNESEPEQSVKIQNQDIFFETNDIDSCIKNRHTIVSRCLKGNIATEKLTIEDTLR